MRDRASGLRLTDAASVPPIGGQVATPSFHEQQTSHDEDTQSKR
jgi:hypothetical protein